MVLTKQQIMHLNVVQRERHHFMTEWQLVCTKQCFSELLVVSNGSEQK